MKREERAVLRCQKVKLREMHRILFVVVLSVLRVEAEPMREGVLAICEGNGRKGTWKEPVIDAAPIPMHGPF